MLEDEEYFGIRPLESKFSLNSSLEPFVTKHDIIRILYVSESDPVNDKMGCARLDLRNKTTGLVILTSTTSIIREL